VREGERLLALGGVKQRSLLAILLLHAGEVVSVDRLIDALWGESPPDDAATALHQHVSRLRKALGAHEVLLTRSPGYVVAPAEGEIDFRRFGALRDTGRRHLEGDAPQEAARALREALSLWRGRPLADLDREPFAAEAVARLDEEWIEAVELRIDADIALGRHAELVGELRTLVRRHPLRERLRGQLMLALYRSGRQAEALAVYADARRTLDEELGLEPGPELRRLQQAILDHDPELERRRPRRAGPPARRRPALARPRRRHDLGRRWRRGHGDRDEFPRVGRPAAARLHLRALDRRPRRAGRPSHRVRPPTPGRHPCHGGPDGGGDHLRAA